MEVLAHGIGGSQDLPIPGIAAIAGGATALTVSFVVLALAWRRPRYDPARAGRPVPAPVAALVDHPLTRWTWRVLGLVFFGYVAWAALAGPDLSTNPALGVFYVWLWVGIVPLSLLCGRAYAALSPIRTLHLLLARATGSSAERGVGVHPDGLGYWPAAIGLFAFVWLELVFPGATYVSTVRLWFAVYLAAMLVGGATYGSRWLERADPFEVYSTLVGHLSFWGRRDDGRLVWRSPLANLATHEPGRGLVAVVAVLLGSTAFDSYKDSPTWLQLTQSGWLSQPPQTLVNTTALLAFCLAVGGSFTLATMLTGVEDGRARRELPALFAHAVAPIVIGYVTAHYLTYLVQTGAQTLIQLSDPLGTGADLLGTADLEVPYWLSLHPTFLATTKVVAVVSGHVVGVISSHDRAVALLPERHRVSGQLSLLVVMVAYTITGLLLLFGT